MEYRFNRIIALLIGLVMFSCEKVEIRGMFKSTELADERFEESMVWNATHPYREIVVTTDAYTLFVGGDSHVGGTVNFTEFIRSAKALHASAMVMAGDITTGRAEDYTLFVSLMPHPDTLASFTMLGNHDLFFNGWESYRSLLGTSSYYFTVKTPEGVDLYICTDSGSSTLGPKQTKWLKELLENDRDLYRRCVLFTHVNFFRDRHTSSTNPMIEEMYVLMDLFIEQRVDMVVMGHDHKRSIEHLGNTTYITMDAMVDEFEDASYMKLNVTDGSISYEFVDF